MIVKFTGMISPEIGTVISADFLIVWLNKTAPMLFFMVSCRDAPEEEHGRTLRRKLSPVTMIVQLMSQYGAGVVMQLKSCFGAETELSEEVSKEVMSQMDMSGNEEFRTVVLFDFIVPAKVFAGNHCSLSCFLVVVALMDLEVSGGGQPLVSIGRTVYGNTKLVIPYSIKATFKMNNTNNNNYHNKE